MIRCKHLTSSAHFIAAIACATGLGMSSARAAEGDAETTPAYPKNQAGWLIGPEGTLTCRVFVAAVPDDRLQVVATMISAGQEALRSRCMDESWHANCETMIIYCPPADKLARSRR